MTYKKDLTERDIVTKFIIPNLVKAGWDIQKQIREENDQAWIISIEELSKNGYNLDIKNPHIAEEEHTYTSAELLEMLHDSFQKSAVLLGQLKGELNNG